MYFTTKDVWKAFRHLRFEDAALWSQVIDLGEFVTGPRFIVMRAVCFGWKNSPRFWDLYARKYVQRCREGGTLTTRLEPRDMPPHPLAPSENIMLSANGHSTSPRPPVACADAEQAPIASQSSPPAPAPKVEPWSAQWERTRLEERRRLQVWRRSQEQVTTLATRTVTATVTWEPMATSIFVDDHTLGHGSASKAAEERDVSSVFMSHFGLTEHPEKGDRVPSQVLEKTLASAWTVGGQDYGPCRWRW